MTPRCRRGVWWGRAWIALLMSAAVTGVLAATACADSRTWSAPVVLATRGAASLGGVACPTVKQGSVVDDPGGEATFDPDSPGSPTPTRVDGSDQLAAVACPSARQCTAVDNFGREVTFDPRSPRSATRRQIDSFPPTLPSSSRVSPLMAVACPSVRQCTALGDERQFTFDPRSPGAVISTTLDGDLLPTGVAVLTGVACSSASQCTAVDNFGNEITFDPRSRTDGAPVPINRYSQLWGIACPSAHQCTAAGAHGRVFTFDPTRPASATATVVGPPPVPPRPGGVSVDQAMSSGRPRRAGGDV